MCALLNHLQNAAFNGLRMCYWNSRKKVRMETNSYKNVLERIYYVINMTIKILNPSIYR